MANQRIEMINLKHIIRLKLKGISNRRIAKQLGMGRQTVDKYVKWLKQMDKSLEELYLLNESALHALLPQAASGLKEKYEFLAKKFSTYEKELKQPGATCKNLWEEYRQEQPQGYSYNQFCYHLRTHQKRQQISLRQEHKYGDKMFVDYCGKKMVITDRVSGQEQEVEIFVSILGASQYIYVEASETQQLEDFLSSNANALAYYRGVPQGIVPDNLKSAVTIANRYEPHVNRNFQSFGLHYNTTILPARAYKPQDKPLVEGAVKLVYQQIFFPLRHMTFFSLRDLNIAIHQQLEKLNNGLFQGRTYSRRDLFVNYEQALLQPLPGERFEMRIYRKAKANKDALAWFGEDKHYYSVPEAYVGKKVQLHATHKVVEIYYKQQRIAMHQRSDRVGGCTINEEHLPAQLRFVKNWSLGYFTNQAQKIGAHTYQYFHRIFERRAHPEQAYKVCMGILSLQKQYPDPRIEQACARAAFFANYSYHTVHNILKKNLDQQDWQVGPLTDDLPLMNQSDSNIRGSKYFQ